MQSGQRAYLVEDEILPGISENEQRSFTWASKESDAASSTGAGESILIKDLLVGLWQKYPGNSALAVFTSVGCGHKLPTEEIKSSKSEASEPSKECEGSNMDEIVAGQLGLLETANALIVTVECKGGSHEAHRRAIPENLVKDWADNADLRKCIPANLTGKNDTAASTNSNSVKRKADAPIYGATPGKQGCHAKMRGNPSCSRERAILRERLEAQQSSGTADT